MKKHGLSHAGALLTCTIAAGLLKDEVKRFVPAAYDVIGKGTDFLSESFPKLNISGDQWNIIIFAAILAGIWGILFSLMHKDKPKRNVPSKKGAREI